MIDPDVAAHRSSPISRVEVFDLERPVSVPTGPSVFTYSSRGSVIVRVEDGDGVVGGKVGGRGR